MLMLGSLSIKMESILGESRREGKYVGGAVA